MTRTTFMIPGDAVDPWAGLAGASLGMSYGVYGTAPEYTLRDVVLSIQKHLAEVLDEVASSDDWLNGTTTDGESHEEENWEVRLSDEPSEIRLPFAKVEPIGPETQGGIRPIHIDHMQSINIHLYPFPKGTVGEANWQADYLRYLIGSAFEFGAARAANKPYVIPLWTFGEMANIYGDSERRWPTDWITISGLSTDRLPDPEDDRYVAVVINFRAQWRRIPRDVPGHLVQSVRMTAYPEGGTTCQ